MEIVRNHNMSFTKKEKAISPKAKCPAIIPILIFYILLYTRLT